MNEKVKLPKFMCDWLKQNEGILGVYPMVDVSTLNRERNTAVDVETWLSRNTTNHWKLIDALRYGYEAEPEPRWGIKAGNCYMDASDSWGFDNVTPKAVIDNDAYWTIKKAADEIVRVLGFGEVVDLNNEGKADEPESEQLYYVQFIKNDGYSFLNSSDSDGLEISDNEETEYIKTKFTMPEIEAIDPRYKTFAVPVEEGEQDEN